MGLLVQQGLVGVLAVHIHQHVPHGFQLRRADQGAVDPADALAAGVQLPVEDHFLPVVQLLIQQVFRGGRTLLHGEQGFHRPLLGAGADALPIGSLAESQPHRLDEDGFAGAGLARQCRKALLEVQGELIDQCDIGYGQVPEHGLCSFISSSSGTA